jgi:sugar lactone lactonase YvrE
MTAELKIKDLPKTCSVHSVTVDAKSNVYTLVTNSSTKKSSVYVFDKTGKLSQTMKDIANEATAITTDEKGNLYLTTRKRDKSKDRKVKRGPRVFTYPGYSANLVTVSPAGKVISTVAAPALSAPTGMEYYKGFLLVADYRLKSVFKINAKTGKVDATFGTKGKISGFRSCCGILDCSVDRKTGTIYVGNLGGFCVAMFDATGKKLGQFGKRGREKKNFCGCCNPVSVSATPGGLIATTEKTTPVVKIFDRKGNMLGRVDISKAAKGCGKMDVVVGPDNCIYVVNMRTKSIMKFEAK